MKWMEIDRQLAASGLKIFTDREFRQIAKTSPVAARFLLIRYTRRGLLCRLKRGLYAVKTRMPSQWAIANRLYRPSYISLSSALSYYGLIPESIYAVTSVTAKTTREFKADNIMYIYRTIKQKAFAGYRSIELEGGTVLIAEREKALADYLYLAFLKKEALNARLRIKSIDRSKLTGYLQAFGTRGLLKWFGHDFRKPD